MANTQHAFDVLALPQLTVPAVVVLFGSEAFLKRLVTCRLRKAVLGDEETPFAALDGPSAEWRDVADELATVSLFGPGRRLVVIEPADPFVSRERARLEDYVERPSRSGVLVLNVEAWPANTRLYKAIDRMGWQIDCRPPEKTVGSRKVLDETRLSKWLVSWARQQHQIRLAAPAAALLLELSGPELGLLDQNLAKLALFVAPDGAVDAALVQEVVGGWRATTIWELVDAAAEGNAAEALRQLHRLLETGEPPVALFGQIAWSLRRLATATRCFQEAERSGQRITLRDALIQAGIPHWNQKGLERAEIQLKQLGRERAGRLYQWLLETDLALKGTHSQTSRARFVLEHLFLRMAKGQRAEATGR